jgi:hypothetical protein
VLLFSAESITSLQHAEWMLTLHKRQNFRGLRKELSTPGRGAFWLTTSKDRNNITIRPLRAKVAEEMMSPRSGSNSVMQLNMGERIPLSLYQCWPCTCSVQKTLRSRKESTAEANPLAAAIKWAVGMFKRRPRGRCIPQAPSVE